MSDEIFLVLAFTVLVGCFALKYCPIHGFERDVIIGPGTYIAGYDIPFGRADLVAESGNGDFCLKQRKSKTWAVGNKIGITSAIQPGRYRNLDIRWGDTLEINGNVTVLVTKPTPIRNVATENLGPGVYRFGLDVPPGRYDVEAVGGDGQIYLLPVGQSEYTIYQDMAKDNAIKAGEYTNLDCCRGCELWVEGSLQVKLKRSIKQRLPILSDINADA